MSSEGGVPDNRTLVTDAIMRETLKTDKGDAAHLVSFKIKDFTNKGDNYACLVTSVIVTYTEGDNQKRETTYVSKITQQIGENVPPVMRDFMHEIFLKESTCYFEIVPKINEALTDAEINNISLAKAYTTFLEQGKEVIVLEDLRPRGFKMFDRRRGMDVAHATLVLKELGRLHAASLLMERSLPTQDVTKTWPVLVEKWMTDDSMQKMFRMMIDGQLDSSAVIMDKIPAYETVASWIRTMKEKFIGIFLSIMDNPDKFFVLTHGDCWNNNILFRYDDTGAPIEVVFVDLQVMRRASATLDLSYYLYSSFNGPVRKNNLKKFLDIYHSSFTSILEAAKVPVPFTREELAEEFERNMIFGCISGLFLIPIVLSEAEDVPDFFNVDEDSLEEYNKQRHDSMMRMSEKSDGLLRPRFLDMFDEMIEAGVIPK